ncbi:MAG: 8-amino-7-oxononanoate synthase [Thermoguttaceae bacterium]
MKSGECNGRSPVEKRLAWIDDELTALENKKLRRRLSMRESPQSARCRLDGRELVNFGSNDYLALAGDPRLADAVAESLRREGWGSGASPLVTGHAALHERLARRIAEFEGAEAALIFSSGFAANVGTVAALVGPGDVVYGDEKNHASLWDGCRLSRADVRVYPHGDAARLAALLAKSSCYRRRLIVTDGLFSMDGDLAPLEALADLAERHDAMLLVDEAHATGVFGQSGRGACEHFGVEARVDVRIGTLSKALGSVGGFVVGRGTLIEWLRNRARSYVFSTAAPAATVAAALAALDIVEREPDRRRQLLDRARRLRESLRADGWDTGASASQIIPVIVGEPDRAIRLSAALQEAGLLAPAIRPPTVPDGQSLLRVSLTAGHTEAMIEALRTALKKCLPSRGREA